MENVAVSAPPLEDVGDGNIGVEHCYAECLCHFAERESKRIELDNVVTWICRANIPKQSMYVLACNRSSKTALGQYT